MFREIRHLKSELCRTTANVLEKISIQIYKKNKM